MGGELRRLAMTAIFALGAFGVGGRSHAALLTFVGGADAVTVNYYANTADLPTQDGFSLPFDFGNYTDTGDGITFTGSPYLTDTIPSISELRDYYNGIDSDPNWPSGATPFGADFSATILAPANGSYRIAFGADDSGYLYVDGAQVGAQAGPKSVTFDTISLDLTAGEHSLELQYDNIYCCGAIAYVGLNGASAAVPEPSTWAMIGLGLAGLAFAARRARRAAIV